MRKFLITTGLIILISGCSTMKPENFANKEPKLDIFQYFQGETSAWGIFEDRFGNLRREFKVDITGTIEAQTLTLDEQFEYSDGERDQRVWKIRKIKDNEFEGRADDVIGVARGTSAGNALKWSYEMALKVGDTSYRVHFDDWMFLQEDDVMINRARVSKWGVDLGEVTLFFKKPEGVSSNN